MNENRKHRILYNPTFGGFIFTVMIIAYICISFVGHLILELVGLTSGVLYYVINAMFSILAMFTVTKVVEIKRQEKRHFLHHFEKCNPKYVLFALIFAVGMFLGKTSSFLKNYFNWRLITLQYCGGFCHN